MSQKFYVYIYLDPRVLYDKHGFTNEPFYVGKGQGNRFKYHLRCSNRLNNYMNDRVSAILHEGTAPIILFLHHTDDEQDAYTVETEWIHKLGRSSNGTGPLLNLTDGGAGTSSGSGHPFFGKKHTDVAKQAISAASKGEKNPFFSKTHSEETRAKMQQRVMSEENKTLLSSLYKGIPLPDEHKANIRASAKRGKDSPLFGTHKSAEEKAKQVAKKAKYRYVVKSMYTTYIVFSLRVFCRYHELDERALNRSLTGKYAHKGMRLMSKEPLRPDWFEDMVLLSEYNEFAKLYKVTPSQVEYYKQAA